MEEKSSEGIKINVKKIFPNAQAGIFFILFFILLLITILKFLGINPGISLFGQFLSLFPLILLWTLVFALAISTILAYLGKSKFMFIPVIIWLLLAVFVIRTPNVSELKDVTTGTWTLAPDLDPFLYLRLAENINNGTLQNPDMMRYAPLGAKNYATINLMPWFIFYFYKISQMFGNDSLTYAAIILPVILFAISTIGFLLFVKMIASSRFSKKKSWACAAIATLFYIFMPAMLHRTLAGVPEIESLGMVWFWFAFIFFILAWREQKTKKMIIYGILAGIFTGIMSWSWGGYRYIYMIIGLTTLIFFFFQKDRIKNRTIFLSWVIPALIIIFLQSRNIGLLMTNMSDTGFGMLISSLLIADFILFDTKLKEKLKLEKINLPRPIISSIIGVLFIILVLLLFNISFLINSINDIIERIQYPFGRARVGLTVAENAVPYFTEIIQNFGSLIWIFVIGTIAIFYETVKKFSLKKRVMLNGFFILFILGFVFSKYSPTSILNGTNLISKIFYLGSLILFGLVTAFIIIMSYIKKDEKTLQDFRDIDFSYILLLVFAFWGIVSMRGAIRLLFIISPIIPLISCFFFIRLSEYYDDNKNEHSKKLTTMIAILIFIIIMLVTFASYSNDTIYSAKTTVPGVYEQQWQQAMSWVRDNTPVGSVFVHWWDYGYWVQTIGGRPTVADGGHYIGYWPHLIGRYVLTTPYPETALSFMKTHNVSYLLIDSTDLGKYGAYSSIGSDETGNDRLSQIPIMNFDSTQSRTLNNSQMRVYVGGVYVDSDIIYDVNGSNIFLPMGKAGIGGITVEISNSEQISQPYGFFIYNQKQIMIPIRYVYKNNTLTDFGGGLNATIILIPSVSQGTTGANVDRYGAAVYLSPKVSDGLFAQLYLMNDPLNKYPTIKIAHSEQDIYVKTLNEQGAKMGEFAYIGGFRGPVKIWKVDYPSNIITREEFLRIDGGYGEFDNLTFTQ